MEKIKVVCLCGSGKFSDEFLSEQTRLTLCGNVVLTPLFTLYDKQGSSLTEKEIVLLKALHLKRIEMADEVRVINKGGYIGESTAKEIEYAKSLNKIITYFEEK